MRQSAVPTGSSIIVTGAAGGIGSAVAQRLAEDGARVVAVDVHEARLSDVVSHLPGVGHIAWATDLSDLAGHDRLVQKATEDGMRLRGMAHLAAVLRRRNNIDEVTEDDWDFQVNVNLKATFFLNRAVVRVLSAQGVGGSIVNFTSQAWWTGGFGGAAVYAATKGGVVSMSRSLARSLAAQGIRVNTVAPGFVQTEMMCGGLTEGEIQAFNAMVPLGRMATSEEIAGGVSFLLSDDSSYITGATLNMTGGQLMY